MTERNLTYANVTATREHGNPMPRMTRDGYTTRGGSPIRTQVQLEGETRWRRVYVLQFSNAATAFVKRNGESVYLVGDRF